MKKKAATRRLYFYLFSTVNEVKYMGNVKNNYVYFRKNKKNYDNWADIQNHLADTKLTI